VSASDDVLGEFVIWLTRSSVWLYYNIFAYYCTVAGSV